jgi:predicted ATPase
MRADCQTAGTFVDLAPLPDPDLMPQTLAAQLGVSEQPGRRVLATLVDTLRVAGEGRMFGPCLSIKQSVY